MLTTLSRIWRPLALLAGIALALVCGSAVLAHADPAVAAAAPPALDWTAIAGLFGAVAGGLGAIFGGISMVLHAVAPRTKTVVDDRLATGIDKAHAKLDDVHLKLDTVFAALRTLQPAPVVRIPPTPTPAAVAAPGTTAMLTVLLLGGLAVATPACGGSQASRAATISSVDSGAVGVVAALGTYEHQQAEAVNATARAAYAAAPDAAGKVKAISDGHAALAALRARTDPAWRAADLAIAALDSARALNDDPSLRGAQAALDNAIAALAALKGGK